MDCMTNDEVVKRVGRPVKWVNLVRGGDGKLLARYRRWKRSGVGSYDEFCESGCVTEPKKAGRKIDEMSVRQYAVRAGLPYAVLYHRLKRGYWTLERALSEPVRKNGLAFSPEPEFGTKTG